MVLRLFPWAGLCLCRPLPLVMTNVMLFDSSSLEVNCNACFLLIYCEGVLCGFYCHDKNPCLKEQKTDKLKD